jgi:hypothetical protein
MGQMFSFDEAQIILGTGRGAMITTLFGAFWLGLSLVAIGTLPTEVIVPFCAIFIALLIGSRLFISKGRKLRKNMPSASNGATEQVRRSFKIISITEGVAIGVASAIAGILHRLDLMAIWIAIIVGLHFLPLARIFGRPVYYATGIAIAGWATFAWISFQGPSKPALAGAGTGIVLWATSAYIMIHGWRLLHSAQAP